MTLGDYRKRAGITQAELSELAGVSLRTIQALESGARSIGKAQLNTVLPIARALSISVEELAGYITTYDGEHIYEGDFEWFPKKG